ncbi:MAG: folate-binding protein YgfZ, partial [Burkholderiales bacterium 21-58-4]
MNDLSPFPIVLDDLAVIEITGADAIAFMHGQITHDIANLPENAARVAGYCSPKGRLLGNLVIWRADNPQTPTLRALIKADIAESIVKRLSMYVLRAKAKL